MVMRNVSVHARARSWDAQRARAWAGLVQGSRHRVHTRSELLGAINPADGHALERTAEEECDRDGKGVEEVKLRVGNRQEQRSGAGREGKRRCCAQIRSSAPSRTLLIMDI